MLIGQLHLSIARWMLTKMTDLVEAVHGGEPALSIFELRSRSTGKIPSSPMFDKKWSRPSLVSAYAAGQRYLG